MKHDQIVNYVLGLNIRELTSETFDDFVLGVRGIYEPKGTKLVEHLRMGLNSASIIHFKNGQRPRWDEFELCESPSEFHSNNLSVRGEKTVEKDARFLVAYRDDCREYDVFGMNRRLPLRFAFDSNKALYWAEQIGNGTPDMPYEHLIVRK